MKFAVIADIHGNSSALKAVVEDLDRLGISEVINLGDHFSGPLDAKGTAELLLQKSFHTVRGNHDRYLLEQDPSEMGPSDLAAHSQLLEVDIDWLRTLPPTLTLFDDVFCCHGTPKSDQIYWLEKVRADASVGSAHIEEIEREAQGVNASLLLCAHSHIPRIVQLRDGRVILNPGSVGCPGYDDDKPVYHKVETGTPNASYAIAKKTALNWEITFRSIPYDSGRMIEMAKHNERAEWACALKTGWLS